jgi:hypothetical protein
VAVCRSRFCISDEAFILRIGHRKTA